MQTTRMTVLGFACVICAAIALLPMLVETDQLSAPAAPEPAAQGLQFASVR